VPDAFVLRNPDDDGYELRYGPDDHGGCWAELVSGTILIRYDSASAAYDIAEPVLGLLRFASQGGLVGGDEIVEALEWISGEPGLELFGPSRPPGWPGRDHRPPRRLRRAIEIIHNLGTARA
jgi:hypothetical protein